MNGSISTNSDGENFTWSDSQIIFKVPDMIDAPYIISLYVRITDNTGFPAIIAPFEILKRDIQILQEEVYYLQCKRKKVLLCT